MNSSFLATLSAVLSGQDEIENLPKNKLIASDQEGEEVKQTVPPHVFLMIARLQTLAFMEDDQSAMQPGENTAAVLETIGDDPVNTIPNALMVQEDGTRRIAMIERLIVEIVREALPAECEVFGVEYFAHESCVLMRRPTLQRRYLV